MRAIHHSLTVVSAALAIALAGAHPATAAGTATDGALDKSFRQTGKVVLSSPEGALFPQALEQQADGKLVVLATLQERALNPSGIWSDVLLGRLLATGEVDSSFGAGGYVRTDLDDRLDVARALRIQADQKILIAGTTTDFESFEDLGDGFLARYLANGNSDPTFGGGSGVVQIDVGLIDDANVLLIQKDKKILVAGTTAGEAGRNEVFLARRLANGSPDRSWGTRGDGIVTTLIETRDAFGFGLAQQPDGKIVLGGFVGDEATMQPYLARFLPNGAFDNTFGGGDGSVILQDPIEVGGGGVVALQKDGKILLGGERHTPDRKKGSWAVFRRLPNGDPDPAFGTNGTARIDFTPIHDGGSGMLLSKSGKLVVAGNTKVQPTGVFGGPIGLARLKSDGKPDPTFGKQGKLTVNLDPTGSTMVWAILQKDGRIVTLNRLNAGGLIHMALTRHLVSPGTARVGVGPGVQRPLPLPRPLSP